MVPRRVVRVSRLNETDIARIQKVLGALAHKSVEAPMWKIVHVQRGQSAYWRRAPGAVQLEKRLGAEAFKLFGVLVSLGASVWEDAQRQDLRPSQRLGRASLELLIGVSPFALLWLGASVIAPEKADQWKNWLFSSTSPHINFIADQLGRWGGKRLQEWSMQPHWVDFF